MNDHKPASNKETPLKLICIPTDFFDFVAQNILHSINIYLPEKHSRTLQSAIILNIKDVKDIYKGEIIELSTNNITLRSFKGTKNIKIDHKLNDTLINENLKIGDICYLESGSGIIKRL